MLIHSWYRLGRGTPHQPGSGVTRHPRQRCSEGLAGSYRKPQLPPAWKPWNLRSSVVPTWTPPGQKFTEGSVLTFQFITLFQKQGTLNALSPTPLPGHRERNSHSALHLTIFSTSCYLSGLDQLYLLPPQPNRYQKGPERMSQILELLWSRWHYCPFFFFLNVEYFEKINAKFPSHSKFPAS